MLSQRLPNSLMATVADILSSQHYRHTQIGGATGAPGGRLVPVSRDKDLTVMRVQLDWAFGTVERVSISPSPMKT
ncbi:MAG: hypothetical protein OEV70_13185 [Nitrospirota bacterium]|jgi:hypothetical protein|nr:hypothetical protein [Nitrospirota bacterium]